ncbi:GD18766 [Drosophila simulans]|uniref:GD18766 n=1 Tax=Drosophila simulans TaxID=7240 RepID=B4QU21_DROSI|nr:GD18766 [Drosophila simulans]
MDCKYKYEYLNVGSGSSGAFKVLFPTVTRRWETDNGQVQCVIRRTPNFSSERNVLLWDWMRCDVMGDQLNGLGGVCLAISPKSSG